MNRSFIESSENLFVLGNVPSNNNSSYPNLDWEGINRSPSKPLSPMLVLLKYSEEVLFSSKPLEGPLFPFERFATTPEPRNMEKVFIVRTS